MPEPSHLGCHVCGKPAFAKLKAANGSLLDICIEHYISLQSVENERLRQNNEAARQNMAMMNLALDEMDATVGLMGFSPRVQIPMPTPSSNYTSINVSNSTIGVINTATVGQISAHIGAIKSDAPIKEALASFTQAIVNDQSLSPEGKKDF